MAWKQGQRSGRRYKLFYSGANKEGRGGVGVVLDAEWKKHIVKVNRCSDRVMNIKLMYGKDNLTSSVLTHHKSAVVLRRKRIFGNRWMSKLRGWEMKRESSLGVI